jgi:subtilase family serine protease
MGHRSVTGALAALAIGVLAAPSSALAAGEAAPAAKVVQPASALATPANRVGATPKAAQIAFEVFLPLREAEGARALLQAVSSPSSPSYRQFLTAPQWESRFSPTPASVNAVTSFLRKEGITVLEVTPDRLTIHASASAETIERVFGSALGEYRHGRHVLRLAASPLRVPGSIAGSISSVGGINQALRTPAALTGEDIQKPAQKPAQKQGEPPVEQPAGFRVARPCSSYYGQKLDSTDPEYGGGYPNPLPYAVCGYTPPQLQSAYGLTPQIAAGDSGSGTTVAIVDYNVSPTLFSDAQEYSAKNEPGETLAPGQFSEILAKHFEDQEECEPAGWFGEQTLDVEAVHATAPGAHILYGGGSNCELGLNDMVQEIVDRHLASVISDSWGQNGGDLLESEGNREAFDNVLLLAGDTGIGVLFSAGDEGDEFINTGINVPDYPPSSPYVTAVGGTSLEVGKGNQRLGEVGWSTSKSVLCDTLLQEEEFPGCTAAKLEKWIPPAPGGYLYGGGGGTSYKYAEPWYQKGVVPAALSERNSAFTHEPNRVEPDISMDADPTTGMLVGETQTFPNGVYYDQYRIGGTSLSSPLLAGVLADADQAAGGALGFINPLLYELASFAPTYSGGFNDIVPAGKQADVRVDYLNGVNAKEGTITSVRTLAYEGKESYCNGSGQCSSQKVTLNTGPGYDSMTGIGTPASGLIHELSKP